MSLYISVFANFRLYAQISTADIYYMGSYENRKLHITSHTFLLIFLYVYFSYKLFCYRHMCMYVYTNIVLLLKNVLRRHLLRFQGDEFRKCHRHQQNDKSTQLTYHQQYCVAVFTCVCVRVFTINGFCSF